MINPEIKSAENIKRAEDIKRELYLGAEKAKNTEELAAEKIDQKDVDKLKAILEDEDFRKTLQEELNKSDSKIRDLLNKTWNQVLLLTKVYNQVKNKEDKAEVALLFDKLGIYDRYNKAQISIQESLFDKSQKLNRLKDKKSDEYKNLAKEIKELEDLQRDLSEELSWLQKSIGKKLALLQSDISVDANSLAGQNRLNKEDGQKERKGGSWFNESDTFKAQREFREKIFKRLKSPSDETDFHFSRYERKTFRQFAGVVNDVIDHSIKAIEKSDLSDTEKANIQVGKTKNWVYVEKFILDKCHEGAFVGKSDQEIIDIFKEEGLVIRDESFVGGLLGERGTDFLDEINAVYRWSHDTAQSVEYQWGSNLREMFDIIRDTGSFQGAINTFSKKVEEADQVRNIDQNKLKTKQKDAKAEAKADWENERKSWKENHEKWISDKNTEIAKKEELLKNEKDSAKQKVLKDEIKTLKRERDHEGPKKPKKKDLRKMIDVAKSEAKDQLKSESIIGKNGLNLKKMPELKNYWVDGLKRVRNIYTDFNFDGMVSYGDAGNRTGTQIREIFDGIADKDKHQAFQNLFDAVNFSRLEKVTAEGQETPEITLATSLEYENLKLIQEFLKNSPVDLVYLLKYGRDEAFKKMNEARNSEAQQVIYERQQIQEHAEKSVTELRQEIQKALDEAEKQQPQNKKAIKHLKKLMEIPDWKLGEGLRDALTSQVASFRQKGFGAGGEIPFDRLLKGLSFHLSSSLGRNGDWTTAIGLAWNKNIKLDEKGKWEAYLWVSWSMKVLWFIPILSADGGLAYNTWKDKMASSLDPVVSKRLSAWWALIWSPNGLWWNLNVGVDANRDASRYEQEKAINTSVAAMITDILDPKPEWEAKPQENLAKADVYKFDEGVLRGKLQSVFKDSMAWQIDQAVKNLGQILKLYHGQPLTKANVELISQDIARAYSNAWSNERGLDLAKQWWYLSGGGLGISFYANWAMIPSITLQLKKHLYNGHKDTTESLKSHEKVLRTTERNVWVDGLADLEKQLGVEAGFKYLGPSWAEIPVDGQTDLSAEAKEKARLSAEAKEKAEYIQISLKDFLKQGRISLSQKVKGNIKIDLEKDNETITVHKNTLLRASTSYLSDWARLNLDIGDVKTDTDALELTYEDLKSGKLSDKLADWSAEKIDPETLPKLRAKLDERKFDAALKKLASKVESPYDFPAQYAKLNINQNKAGDWVLYNGEDPCLDAGGHPFIIPQWKHLVIDMTGGKGLLKLEDMVNTNENFKIKLELPQKPTEIGAEILEMNETVKDEVEGLYSNLSLLQSNAIRNVAHNETGSSTLTTSYNEWRSALSRINKDESTLQSAAGTMITLLKNMDTYIQHTDGKKKAGMFNQVVQLLGTYQDSKSLDDSKKVELKQLLLALDGMFSRTTNVRGTQKANQYRLEYNLQSDPKKTFKNIAQHTAKKIIEGMWSEKWKNSFPCKDEYATLFSGMNGKANIDSLNKNQAIVESESEKWVIAYNYGNSADLMRPIVDPHIIKWTKLKDSNQEGGVEIPVEVKEHVLKQLFEQDSVLVAGLVNKLASDLKMSVEQVKSDIVKWIPNLVKWETIDIWVKKVSMSAEFSTAFFAQCVNHMVMIWGLKFTIGETTTPDNPNGNKKEFAAEIEADTQVIASNVGESKVHNITKAAAVSAAVNLSKPQVPGQPPESPGYDWETNQEWWTWTGTGSGGDGSTETTGQNTHDTTGTWNGGDSDGGWGSGR